MTKFNETDPPSGMTRITGRRNEPAPSTIGEKKAEVIISESGQADDRFLPKQESIQEPATPSGMTRVSGRRSEVTYNPAAPQEPPQKDLYTSPNMMTGTGSSEENYKATGIFFKSVANSLLDGFGSMGELAQQAKHVYDQNVARPLARALGDTDAEIDAYQSWVRGKNGVAGYLAGFISGDAYTESLGAAGKALKSFDFGGATKISDEDQKKYWIASGLGSGVGQIIPMWLAGGVAALAKAPRAASILNQASIYAAETTGYIEGFEKETGKNIEDNPNQFLAANLYGMVASKLEQLGIDPTKFGSGRAASGARKGIMEAIDAFTSNPEITSEVVGSTSKKVGAIIWDYFKKAGMEGVQEGLQTLSEVGVSALANTVSENDRRIPDKWELATEVAKSAAIGAMVGGIVSPFTYISKSARSQTENVLFDYIHNGVDTGTDLKPNASALEKANAMFFETEVQDKKTRLANVLNVIYNADVSDEQRETAIEAVRNLNRISNNIGSGISGENAMKVFDYLKKADTIDAEIEAINSGRDGKPGDALNEKRIKDLKAAREEYSKAIGEVGKGKLDTAQEATMPARYSNAKDFLEKNVLDLPSVQADTEVAPDASTPTDYFTEFQEPSPDSGFGEVADNLSLRIPRDNMERMAKEKVGADGTRRVIAKNEDGDYVVFRADDIPAQTITKEVDIAGDITKIEEEVAPARVEYTPLKVISKDDADAVKAIEQSFTADHIYNYSEPKSGEKSKGKEKKEGSVSTKTGEVLSGSLEDYLSKNEGKQIPKGTKLYIARGKLGSEKIVELTVSKHDTKTGKITVIDESSGKPKASVVSNPAIYFLNNKSTSTTEKSSAAEPATKSEPTQNAKESKTGDQESEPASEDKPEKAKKPRTEAQIKANPTARTQKGPFESMNSILAKAKDAAAFMDFLTKNLLPFIRFSYAQSDGKLSRNYPTGLRLALSLNSRDMEKGQREGLAKYLQQLSSDESLDNDSLIFTAKEADAIRFLLAAYEAGGFRFRFGNRGNFNGIQDTLDQEGTLTPYKGSILFTNAAIEEAIQTIPEIIDSQYDSILNETEKGGIIQIALAYAATGMDNITVDTAVASDLAIQQGLELTEALPSLQSVSGDEKAMKERSKAKSNIASVVAGSLGDTAIESTDEELTSIKSKYKKTLAKFGAGKEMVIKLMARAMELSAMKNAEFDAMSKADRAEAMNVLNFVHEVDKYLITYNYEKSRSNSSTNEGSGSASTGDQTGRRKPKKTDTEQNPRQDIRFAGTPAGIKLKELATGNEASKNVEAPKKSSGETERKQEAGRNEDVVPDVPAEEAPAIAKPTVEVVIPEKKQEKTPAEAQKALTKKEFSALKNGDKIVYEDTTYEVVDTIDRSGKRTDRKYMEVGVANGQVKLDGSETLYMAKEAMVETPVETPVETVVEPTIVEPVVEATPAQEPTPAPKKEKTVAQEVKYDLLEMGITDLDGNLTDVRLAQSERRNAINDSIRIRLEIDKTKAEIERLNKRFEVTPDDQAIIDAINTANESIANSERVLARQAEIVRQLEALSPLVAGKSVSSKNLSSMAAAKSEVKGDKNKVAILDAVEKAFKTLFGLVPGINIVTHLDHESFVDAVEAAFRANGQEVPDRNGEFYENGLFVPNTNTILIDATRSTPVTVYHEAAHIVLRQLFGSDSPAFSTFRSRINSILRFSKAKVKNWNGRMVSIPDALDQFVKAYEQRGDSQAEVAEEYLVQLAGYLSDSNIRLSDTIMFKITKLINDTIRVFSKKTTVFSEAIDAARLFDHISQSLRTGAIIGRDSASELAEAKNYVHENIDKLLAHIGKLYPSLAKIKSSLAPSTPQLSNSEKFNMLKKAFGETNAKIIRSNMPLAFENTEALIPFLKEKIPVKDHMAYILKEMGIEVEKDFFAKPENKSKSEVANPKDLLKEVGYTFYEPIKNLDEAEPFRTYYEGEGSDGRIGGSIICTYRDPNRPKANFVMFIVKDGAAETMRANKLTQENLSEEWKKYLESKGRKNEDGTFNLVNLRPEREDPFSTSVLAIQVNKSNGSLKMISRYNHDLKYGNPDITFGGDLNKITQGLEDSIYKYVGISKSKQKTSLLPDKMVSDSNGKLFVYSKEVDGVYYGDGFYIQKGESTILDPSREKLINGIVFKDGKMDTVLHGFYSKDAGAIILQQKPTIETIPGGKVRMTFYNETKGDNRTAIGSLDVPVKDGATQQNTRIDNSLEQWYIRSYGKISAGEELIIPTSGDLHMFLGDTPIAISGNVYTDLERISDFRGVTSILGSLDVGKGVKSLGKIKSISVELIVSPTADLEDLGELETVVGNAYLASTNIKSLGKLKRVYGTLYIGETQIETTGDLEEVGSISAKDSELNSIPNVKLIPRNLYADHTKIKDLGILKYIGGTFNARDTPIESLGRLEGVGENLVLGDLVNDLGMLKAVGGRMVIPSNRDLSANNLEYAKAIRMESMDISLPKLKYVLEGFYAEVAESIDLPLLEVVGDKFSVSNPTDINIPSIKYIGSAQNSASRNSLSSKKFMDLLYESVLAKFANRGFTPESGSADTSLDYFDATMDAEMFGSKLLKDVRNDAFNTKGIKSSLAPVISAENSSNYANMTEDGEGNFVFYHYGPRGIKTIDPTKYGTNERKATSAAESAAMGRVGGMSQYYVNEQTAEPNVTGDKYMVKVPVEKVYDFNTDPLGLAEEAKAAFEKENPLAGFSANDQLAYITKIAGTKGYDMVVSQWKDTTRAQTTKALTPSDTQIIDGNTITQNFKNTYQSNKEKGFSSVVPVSKEQKLQEAYDKIHAERNAKGKYDRLYHLYADSRGMTQTEITDLIRNSDLSKDSKALYEQALAYKPEARRSIAPEVQATQDNAEPSTESSAMLGAASKAKVDAIPQLVVQNKIPSSKIKASLNPVFRTEKGPDAKASKFFSTFDYVQKITASYKFPVDFIQDLMEAFAKVDDGDSYRNPRLIKAMIEIYSYGRKISSSTSLADLQKIIPGITDDERLTINLMIEEMSDPDAYHKAISLDHVVMPDGKVVEESSWVPKMAEEAKKTPMRWFSKELMSLATMLEWAGVKGSGFYEFMTTGYTQLREKASTHTNRLTEKQEAIISEALKILRETGKGVIMTGRTRTNKTEYDNLEKVDVVANTKNGKQTIQVSIGEAIQMILSHDYLKSLGWPTFLDLPPINGANAESTYAGVFISNKNFEGVVTMDNTQIAKLEDAINKYPTLLSLIKEYYHGEESMEMYRDITINGMNYGGNVAQVEQGFIPIDVRSADTEADSSMQASEIQKFEAVGFQLIPKSAKQIMGTDIGLTMNSLIAQAKIGLLNVPVQETIRWYVRKMYKSASNSTRPETWTIRKEYAENSGFAEWFQKRLMHGYLLSPDIKGIEKYLSAARAASIFPLRVMGGLLQFSGMIKAYGSTVLKSKYIRSDINLYRKMFLSPKAIRRIYDGIGNAFLGKDGPSSTNIAAWTKLDWAKYVDPEIAEIVAEVKAYSPVLYDRFLNNMILLQDTVNKVKDFIPEPEVGLLRSDQELKKYVNKKFGNAAEAVKEEFIQKTLTYLMGGMYWGDALAVISIVKAAKRQAAAEGKDIKFAMALALAATEETQVMDDDAYKSNLTLQSRGSEFYSGLLRQLIAFQQESQSLLNMYAQAHIRYIKGKSSYNGSSAGATYAKVIAIAGVGSAISYAGVQILRGALLKTICGDTAHIYKDAVIGTAQGVAATNPIHPVVGSFSRLALDLSNTEVSKSLGIPAVGKLPKEDLSSDIGGAFNPFIRLTTQVMNIDSKSSPSAEAKKAAPLLIPLLGIPGDITRLLFRCLNKVSPTVEELTP